MSMLIRRFPVASPTLASFIESAFSDPFFAREWPGTGTDEGTLPIDLSEDDASVIVRASLPGFRKEDVEIEVEDGVLSINAKHEEQHEEKKERFYRQERRITSMSRRIALPTAVVHKDTQAELKDGVLTLRLPKVQKPQPQRIQIRAN